MVLKKTAAPVLDSTERIKSPKLSSEKSSAAEDTAPEIKLLAEMEDGLSSIENEYPVLAEKSNLAETRTADLKALLEISQAINSSLVLDEILQKVMKHAIDLLQAERGFLMLLDEKDQLQFRIAHNITREKLAEEDFRISNSIANSVAKSGVSVYTSDAQADERYSRQKSIAELNLRSIMCVPLKIKDKIIGVAYLDNSSEAKIFLQSDLYLFELFAEQASIAIENAKLYENLLALKKYNENIVNRTPVGIIVVDRSFCIASLNDAAFGILAPPTSRNAAGRRQIEGANILELIGRQKADYWRASLLHVLETGQAFDDSRYYYSAADDEERVLNIKISPLEMEGQQARRLIVVLEDVTEKVILENYVMLSEKLVAKGEMAASIGHELNNYLAIVTNNAELLQRNLGLQHYEKLESNARGIIENIAKIKRFTDGLMDFSRLEKEVVVYDIKKLVDDLLFSIKPQRNFEGIKFEVAVGHDLPQVEMDVGQIQQVLLNLIYNSMEALKADSRSDGVITIRAGLIGQDRRQVFLEVIDNGPGITRKNLEKIFEPGFTTKTSGHGLGLVNCKRIIENHQGKIEINSIPNQQTIFRIVLPVCQTSSA